MLTIRLSQVGKKNKKMYRLVISEKARDTFGKALEILGSYNPHSKELQVKADRIKYWISNGAGLSATVNNLLIDNKVIEGEKQKASKSRKKKKEAEEKKETPKVETPAEEAPKEDVKIEKAPVEETPKEETPKEEAKKE